MVTTLQGMRNRPLSETGVCSVAKPISVSQLSRANQRIPAFPGRGLIEAVLAVVSPAAGSVKMPDVGPVRAIDASLFRVPPSFHWAKYQSELQAAKILV